jgi:hypothetical protein
MGKHVANVSLLVGLSLASAGAGMAQESKGLWGVYDEALKGAKYIDLTHVIGPSIPVWYGFGPSKFEPTKAGADIEGFVKKAIASASRSTASRRRTIHWTPTSSAHSLTRQRIGRRNIRQSTSCRRPTQCVLSS